MIVHDVEQGSAEWFRVRLGIPTASCADQIITPVKAELSKSSTKYIYRLLAERLLKMPTETIEGQAWQVRGREQEPLAVRQYQFVNEVETEPAGFVTTDDGSVGASPDRFLKGRRAGLEVKAPAPHVQIQYLLEGPGEAYRPQVQCQLHVCEFEFVDFYSYTDRMPPCWVRTYRDEEYIGKLRDALDQFNARLLSLLERARSLGVFQAYEAALTPTEVERAQDLDSVFRHELAVERSNG